MKSTTRNLLFLFVIFSATPAHSWEVRTAPSTRKVLPDRALPGGSSVALFAARNEWEGFQLVIRSDLPQDGVNVSVSDLCPSGGGPCVGKRHARLYREHMLTITEPSPLGVRLHERKAGTYPDPLIPFFDPYSKTSTPVGAPFALAAGRPVVVYVDWYVPSGTAPGAYAGKATVTAPGQPGLTVPITLTVWELDIPKERTVATAFGFGDSQVRYYHGGSGSAATKDINTIIDRYHAAMHDHRIDPTTVNGSVSFSFDSAGKLKPVDWTAYDKAVGPWIDGSKFADGVPVTRFNIGRFRVGHGTSGMTDDRYKQAARAFAEHLQQKGWWKKAYVYAKDEPWLTDADTNYARIQREADLLLSASSLWKNKVLVTSPYDKRLDGRVGIWCPVTPMFEGWWWGWQPHPGRKLYADRIAKGEELWFYVCNANTPPYAGYDIDSTIGYEPRIVKWGTWYEGAVGFLYWRVSYWVDKDPWNRFANVAAFTNAGARNGDGFLLYPGDHDGTAGGKGSPASVAIDGPIVSYRLKQIRDGLEDWELFRLAQSAGVGDYARRQVARAYTRFGDFFMEGCNEKPFYYCYKRQPWTLDENVLLDARKRIAQKILYAKYPSKYPDPQANEPPDAGPDGINAGGDAIAKGDTSADLKAKRDTGGAALYGGACNCAVAEPDDLPGVVVLMMVFFAVRKRERWL